MGIDIETYRLRIGLRGTRAPREKRAKFACHDLCDDFVVYFMIWMVVATVSCICTYVGGLALTRCMLSSNFARHFGEALAGEGMHVPLNATLSMPGTAWSGYDRDLFSLLVIAGDVEMNPGPDMSLGQMESMLKALREDIRKDIRSEVSECVAREMATLSSLIHDLSDKIDRFESDVDELRRKLDDHDLEMREINQACENIETRLEETEQRAEEQERRDRRDNVLIHGLPESENESLEESQKLFVKTVNEVVPALLTERDVVRAHRVGKKLDGKERPLIARLVHTTDKLAILGAREDFRKKGFGVKSDLTVQQRAMVDQARKEGQIGFFRGGKFCTKPRPDSSTPVKRPTTRSKSRHQPESR